MTTVQQEIDGCAMHFIRSAALGTFDPGMLDDINAAEVVRKAMASK